MQVQRCLRHRFLASGFRHHSRTNRGSQSMTDMRLDCSYPWEHSRANNVLTAQPGLRVFACTPRHSLVAPYLHQDHDHNTVHLTPSSTPPPFIHRHSSTFLTAPRQVTMPVRTRRQAAQPFRFLDLPLEIRLIIYDLLPITTKYHTLVNSTASKRYKEEIVSLDFARH